MFKKIILYPYALRAFISFNFCLAVSLATAEDTAVDSIRHRDLHEVKVNANHLKTTRAALPVQIITEKELGRFNASNISDIAKHFAGVTVKDYGGIGGLKTVSIRGLGAMHTGVSYDGTMMSDVQSGQIDLSQFSIENIAEVSLINGQPNDLLQPARMFASAGVLSFKSKTPAYIKGHTFSGNLTTKIGSFGMYNPSVYINKSFSKKFGVNLSVNALKAKGDYSFKYNLNRQGENWASDKRKNSDIESLRSELNTEYKFTPGQFISFKANHYYSERGLPGTVTFGINFSADRIMDKKFITQLHYENKSASTIQYQFSGKFNAAEMNYVSKHPNYYTLLNGQRVDNYKQTEYYLTSSLQYRPNENIALSSSVDWWYNDLFSESNLNFRKDAAPTRNTGLANLAAKYTNEKLAIGGNILYTLCHETNQTGAASANKNKLSPTAFVSYKLIEDKEFRIRAFFKNIFRLPTFTDLYYHDFGYSKLRPENTYQYNIGVTYSDSKIAWLDELECTFDAYYNKVSDKISVVNGMPFSSVRNIGQVDIKGSDINLNITKRINPVSKIYCNVNYTFQLAQDFDTESENYKDIIPYTPIHSGTGAFTYQYKNIECGYNFCFAGLRYSGDNSESDNKLKAYIDHNLFGKISYKKLVIKAEAINLSNKNYEVIIFYPMPGRNYRFTLSYKI